MFRILLALLILLVVPAVTEAQYFSSSRTVYSGGAPINQGIDPVTAAYLQGLQDAARTGITYGIRLTGGYGVNQGLGVNYGLGYGTRFGNGFNNGFYGGTRFGFGGGTRFGGSRFGGVRFGFRF